VIRRGSTYVDESCRNLFQNNFIEQDTLPAGWYRATLHAPRPRSTARKPVVGRRKLIPIRPIRQEMKSRVITHAARERSSFSASRHEGDVCQRRWQQPAPLPQKSTVHLGMVKSEIDRWERSRRIAVRRTDSETRSVDSACQRAGNRSRTQVALPQPCSWHTVR